MQLNTAPTSNTQQILNSIASAIKLTMGPYGSTTIIESQVLNHTATKDGYTVLNSLFSKDSYTRTLLELIKKISFKLVRTVGDGSTSAVVAAAKLNEHLTEFMNTNSLPPQEVLSALDIIKDKIIEAIPSYACSVTKENLLEVVYNITKIATNGDREVNSVMNSIYEQCGTNAIISVGISKNDKTYFESNSGIRIPRGLVNPFFATEHTEKGYSCEIENANVFMCDGRLTEVDLLPFGTMINTLFSSAQVLGKAVNIVVVANGYDQAFIQYAMDSKQSGIPIALVDFATNTLAQVLKFEDLSIYLGANPIYTRTRNEKFTNPDPLKYIGKCKVFKSSDNSSEFIEGSPIGELLEIRKTNIMDAINDMQVQEGVYDRTTEINMLRLRLADIDSNVVTIYVGGDSDQEKQTRKFLIEDAIFACRSAIQHGVTYAGNLLIPSILLSNKELVSDIEKVVLSETIMNSTEISELISTVVYAWTSVYKEIIHHVDGFADRLSDEVISITREEFSKNNTDRFEDFSLSDTIANVCVTSDYIFNARNLSYEKKSETSIINSVQTDIEILKSCVSIIGLIATSNQFISLPKFG
jgi:chaperonin GroEL